jgi:hypothetical protein
VSDREIARQVKGGIAGSDPRIERSGRPRRCPFDGEVRSENPAVSAAFASTSLGPFQ